MSGSVGELAAALGVGLVALLATITIVACAFSALSPRCSQPDGLEQILSEDFSNGCHADAEQFFDPDHGRPDHERAH